MRERANFKKQAKVIADVDVGRQYRQYVGQMLQAFRLASWITGRATSWLLSA